MPIDKNYGYQIPETGDESSEVWMPVIEETLDRLIEHTHDGVNSPVLTGLDIVKYTQELLTSKEIFTNLTYVSGEDTVDIGPNSIVAGMYGYGDDLPLSTSVLSVTGNNVTLSNSFTASATGTGTLTFSNYEKIQSSLFQRTVTLPVGYISKEYHKKFYITSTGANYYLEVNPDITETSVNTFVMRINDDNYDIMTSLI